MPLSHFVPVNFILKPTEDYRSFLLFFFAVFSKISTVSIYYFCHMKYFFKHLSLKSTT